MLIEMSEAAEEDKEETEEKEPTKKEKKVMTLSSIRGEIEKHRKRNIEEGDMKDAGRLARVLELLSRCD
jgi:hypothetical protein